VTMTSGFLKQKDVDRYFDILKRARKKAGKDTVYDKRIAQIEEEMQPLKKQFAELKRVGPPFEGYVTDIPVKIDGDLSGEELEHAIGEATNAAGAAAKQLYVESISQMVNDMDLNLPGLDSVLTNLTGGG
jgi:DNA-binding protein YbaB